MTDPQMDDQLARVVDQARADLATRLGADAAEFEIVLAERLTWPDGSLGCPEPGAVYTQALVEGYRVIVGHSGRVYAYHAAGDGEPFLCPSGEHDGGREFVPPPGIDD